jgi:glycine cleavage system H protein
MTIEIENMKFPLDRFYFKGNDSHIWLKVEDGIVKIGLDTFLTDNAGYLNYITIDSKEAKSGESIGYYESAKFVSKFYSPITGEIIEVNDKVINNPILINEDPYDSWIVAIKPIKLEEELESENIMQKEEELKNWIETEVKRLEEYDLQE